MSRTKSSNPKLFRKGHGNYRFRRFINGKDKEINTGTIDKQEAEKFLVEYLSGERLAEEQVRKKKNPAKIATLVMEAIDSDYEQLPLEDVFELWYIHSPNFSTTSQSHQQKRKVWFAKFVKFCFSQGITYFDEVNESIAIRFKSFLLKERYCPSNLNEYLAFLSNVHKKVDRLKPLPFRNPFVPEVIQPQKVPKKSEATHLPFDDDMLAKVMKAAAEEGQDWLDLFIVGSQTGMRLKDACLFQWDEIDGDFIEYSPEKTIQHGNTARLPVSPNLASLLERRREQNQNSPYVNPVIAEFYLNGTWPTKNSKKIIEKALGKETTQLSKEGRQRMKNGCIYGFHSFRTTFMTLLATKNVEVRDAMDMLGWESVEMMRLYEKLLAKGREARDQRNKKLIDNLSELQFEVPEPKPDRLWPTKEALEQLIESYSNITIGKIYGISSKAVGNWLEKFGLMRQGRILSPDVTEEEILKIREELQAA